MNKTTIRLSEFTQDRLKQIARRKGLSVSQLINEISLRYIGAEEGARMMEERVVRSSKEKAYRALEAIRQADRPPVPGDGIPSSRKKHRSSLRQTRRSHT